MGKSTWCYVYFFKTWFMVNAYVLMMIICWIWFLLFLSHILNTSQKQWCMMVDVGDENTDLDHRIRVFNMNGGGWDFGHPNFGGRFRSSDGTPCSFQMISSLQVGSISVSSLVHVDMQLWTGNSRFVEPWRMSRFDLPLFSGLLWSQGRKIAFLPFFLLNHSI